MSSTLLFFGQRILLTVYQLRYYILYFHGKYVDVLNLLLYYIILLVQYKLDIH